MTDSAAGRPAEPLPAEPTDDRVYVQRALEGEEAAFAILVRRYERGMYNLAWRMVRERELARALDLELRRANAGLGS